MSTDPRAHDSHRLAWLAHKPSYQLAISPLNTPAEIANFIAAHLRNYLAAVPRKPRHYSSVFLEAISAMLYTRTDQSLIELLWAEYFAPYDREDFGGVRFRFLQNEMAEYADAVLLAAFGDPTLVEWAISVGADVNADTNWFGKTPLMYAAQLDDLQTTQQLLSFGADPSAQTEGEWPGCPTLERDNRTPLMYAAENGSPALIELLISTGADVTMADTQGNAAAWYLDRNESLDASEKARLAPLLTP